MPRGSDRAQTLEHAASAGGDALKLEERSPTMAPTAIPTPTLRRNRGPGATIVVKPSDTTRPRTVLEDPNTGCPSHSLRAAIKRAR